MKIFLECCKIKEENQFWKSFWMGEGAGGDWSFYLSVQSNRLFPVSWYLRIRHPKKWTLVQMYKHICSIKRAIIKLCSNRRGILLALHLASVSILQPRFRSSNILAVLFVVARLCLKGQGWNHKCNSTYHSVDNASEILPSSFHPLKTQNHFETTL
jgi:hypothetical protein